MQYRHKTCATSPGPGPIVYLYFVIIYLLKGITFQKPWQTLITWLCDNHHNRVSLRDLVKSAPVAGRKWYWFHKDNTYERTDIVDKTKIIELYRKTPTGELLHLHDTSLPLPPRSLLPNHEYKQDMVVL